MASARSPANLLPVLNLVYNIFKITDMSKFRKYFLFIIPLLMTVVILPSCEEFMNPVQELKITDDKLYEDWYEYRAVEMGLYALQQQLVEQMVVLGELRGDLLTITPNADADLVEVYNFNIEKTNKYASPTNFFKLISACNNFIRVLKTKHPEVLDPNSPVSKFDQLYGEVLCMRAWAYFNAVRIYGKVPFIHESLTTIEEIENYVNSSGTYTDSVYIAFGPEGYYNDTLSNVPVVLEKKYYDMNLVIDYFTNQLEKEVKAVGVNHHIDNGDLTWEVTIWNPYAMDALLGQMYLEQGNFVKADAHFSKIIYNSTDNLRYQLDQSYAGGNWRNIFSGIDPKEHIFTIWFNKANFQQNEFQSFFEPFSMDKYMLKPSSWAISNWETTWRQQVMQEDLANPALSEMRFAGIPSDFYRGYGSSYLYIKNGDALSANDYMNMLMLKADGDNRGANAIMDGVDTMVFKYSINKQRYDMDAHFIVYRAASIHLYMAEIYTFWAFEQNGLVHTYTNNALNIVNDGSNYTVSLSRPQLGVRGRVGLGSESDGIRISNYIYTHDPYTNEITGYTDLTGNFPAKQAYLEEEIMNERARELAYEGERFYDLMRVAKRRNDPSYLAKKVSAKYTDGKREQIGAYLMNPENWYIKYFEE
jgi:hypothetical protein